MRDDDRQGEDVVEVEPPHADEEPARLPARQQVARPASADAESEHAVNEILSRRGGGALTPYEGASSDEGTDSPDLIADYLRALAAMEGSTDQHHARAIELLELMHRHRTDRGQQEHEHQLERGKQDHELALERASARREDIKSWAAIIVLTLGVTLLIASVWVGGLREVALTLIGLAAGYFGWKVVNS